MQLDPLHVLGIMLDAWTWGIIACVVVALLAQFFINPRDDDD